MAFNPKDYYFKQAKKKNYAARSIFKLEEIDERFHLIKQGYKVLDLGAAPGSWSQYASEKVGPQGRVLGIDLTQIRLSLENAVFVQADILSLDLEKTFADLGIAPPFDVVMSDMAPKTTGNRIVDQARSLELCEMALSAAERFLRPRGNFVVKLFHSGDFEAYRDKLRERFNRVEVLRPKSTRSSSKEIFLIGIQYKGDKR